MNSLLGRVDRNIYLGPARDYVVTLPDDTQLRVTAAPDVDLAAGSAVTLRLPEARCRLLSR